jgi:hypothetical protein
LVWYRFSILLVHLPFVFLQQNAELVVQVAGLSDSNSSLNHQLLVERGTTIATLRDYQERDEGMRQRMQQVEADCARMERQLR